MNDRRAVIFDMDGVIVLTAKAHWAAWSAVAMARGVELSRQRFLSFNGLANADICARLFGDAVTPQLVAGVAADKEVAFRRAIGNRVPLAPGLLELLSQLRQQGIAVALGSSAPAENVDLVLDGGRVRQLFDAVVHADMVRRGKPAPDIFSLAAEMVDVEPGRCVVIEDAPLGIRAALAAGIRVVALATNHSREELLAAGAGVVAPTLAELPVEWLLSSGPSNGD